MQKCIVITIHVRDTVLDPEKGHRRGVQLQADSLCEKTIVSTVLLRRGQPQHPSLACGLTKDENLQRWAASQGRVQHGVVRETETSLQNEQLCPRQIILQILEGIVRPCGVDSAEEMIVAVK